MNTAVIPLARVLPQTDASVARLRSCVRGARDRVWPASSSGIRFALDTGPESTVGANSLLAVVHTPMGGVSLAFSSFEWPTLASAATLPEGPQRAALALLLLGDSVGSLAGMLWGVDLRQVTSPGTPTSGIVLRWADRKLHVVQADEGLLDVVRAWSGRLTPQLPTRADALRLPSVLLLAGRRLPFARLATLREGDILLFPTPTDIERGESFPTLARLSWGDGYPGGLHARVSLQNSTMTLIDAPSDAGMPDTTGSVAALEPASAPRLSLARLELPMQFELAGPSLRLADIANLAAGDVLELSVPVEQARVRITIAHQWVGIGELVAVGGRMGVRIQRVDLADFQGAAP